MSTDITAMNPFAYRTTGLAIKTLSSLSKANVRLHGVEALPEGPKIFVINHFTRLETFLMPWVIHKLVKQPVWSLAAAELFVGPLGAFLEKVGAVSTRDPDRDRLIVKSLLTAEACWIIFPEGRMVKSKKIIEKGRYMISYAGGKHPPHTGAAQLALRAAFFRKKLQLSHAKEPEYGASLLKRFGLDSIEQVADQYTLLVPVNLTYYPIRARENMLSRLAERLLGELPDRIHEELMTEGAMFLSGVDIDIRFGEPIAVEPCLDKRRFKKALRQFQSFEIDPPVRIMRNAALKLTRQYMDAIYGMTTVNTDHIFASLLRACPRAKIDLRTFRQKAFLAVCDNCRRLGIYLHPNLDGDQENLLLDDRQGELADFFKLAEEKQVVELKKSGVIKNQKKLGTIFDFHLARVNNPIAVVANEVEPLVNLQKRISRLAWTPGFIVRRAVRRRLLHKARQEFDRDYKHFYQIGETKPPSIGMPRLLKGRRRLVGLVISHGYMAAPAEVLRLAEHLNRKGYWVYLPRLKGHGTSPEDLAGCSFDQWIRSVEEGYGLMQSLCRHVVVGGFSTGAALALELASRCEQIAGVFAVSTPLRLQYLVSRMAPAMDVWNKLMDKINWDEAKKEFVENRPENPHINYLRNPIAGVRELERLMGYLESRLPHVKVPALVVQSAEDPVVNPKGSEKVFHELGSGDKQYVLFNFNRHGILLGKGAERVYRVIADFVDHITRRLNTPGSTIN